MVELLREYRDCFAWNYDELLRLKRELVEHKLPIKPRYKPVKQQPQRMTPRVTLKVKEEIERLFRTVLSEYPEVESITRESLPQREISSFGSILVLFCSSFNFWFSKGRSLLIFIRTSTAINALFFNFRDFIKKS